MKSKLCEFFDYGHINFIGIHWHVFDCQYGFSIIELLWKNKESALLGITYRPKDVILIDFLFKRFIIELYKE